MIAITSAPAKHHLTFVDRLLAQGGPRQSDYAELDAWIGRVQREVDDGLVSQPELTALRDAFGEALTPATMQGFALRKPHGYAGDFEVIDRMYRQKVSPEPHLAAWDCFYHQHAAAKAVRNRKNYFHGLLDRHSARRQPLHVLNIASGPGRCMCEWLSANPTAEVIFHCIEIDPKAIEYATRLNHSFLDRISFFQKNVLRFTPARQYDLIWAAGISDYFSDTVLQSLLRRLLPALAPDGELVIGNFSRQNPSRPYMEVLADWRLNHRSPETLSTIAANCGVPSAAIHIGAESEGVNLFLHIDLGYTLRRAAIAPDGIYRIGDQQVGQSSAAQSMTVGG